MFAKFKPDVVLEKDQYGRDRDYNIDLIPKFAMASGELVSILVHTDVTRYIDFVQIAGSFVYREGSGIQKVPSTRTEALSSPLMGIMEKYRVQSFFGFCQQTDPDKPVTWQGVDLKKVTMLELYKSYSLGNGLQDFIGHSLALHLDEGYLKQPALETIRRIRLYMSSMIRFGKSPYVYPMYGLGELPQGFARLSAIYGGTYILDKKIEEIVRNEDGLVCGVRLEGDHLVKCSAVFVDPSYAIKRCDLTHRVIRAICLLNHPIPNTDGVDSCQIIIPQRQLKRTHDVYIACLSSVHQVCPKGYYVAIVSTICETEQPEQEITFGLSLLGNILEKFVSVVDMYEPLLDGRSDGLFISKSYDATSHFETVCDDVKDLYQRYNGKPLTLKARASQEEEQENLSRSFSHSASINDV